MNDLDDRLTHYRTDLDAAIETDRRRVRTGDPVPARKPWPAFAAAAAVVGIGVAGIIAVAADDHDAGTSVATSVPTPDDASPTEGLLPRYLLDPADGWTPVRVEDYLLRDSGGAFTMVRFERPDGATVEIALRRTREPVYLGSGGYDHGPCVYQSIELGYTGEVAYASGEGDGAFVTWQPERHVLARLFTDGVSEDDAVEIARTLTVADEAGWSALLAEVGDPALVFDPADERATFQQQWTRAEITVRADDSWEWNFVYCTNRSAG